MAELNDEKLVQVANDSLEIVRRFYKKKGEISDDDLAKARMASTMFGAFVKYRQHQSNMGAIKMAVATQIIENPDERQIYLRIAAPELKLAEVRNNQLREAGVDPESLEPKEYKTDEKGWVEK